MEERRGERIGEVGGGEWEERNMVVKWRERG